MDALVQLCLVLFTLRLGTSDATLKVQYIGVPDNVTSSSSTPLGLLVSVLPLDHDSSQEVTLSITVSSPDVPVQLDCGTDNDCTSLTQPLDTLFFINLVVKEITVPVIGTHTVQLMPVVNNVTSDDIRKTLSLPFPLDTQAIKIVDNRGKIHGLSKRGKLQGGVSLILTIPLSPCSFSCRLH